MKLSTHLLVAIADKITARVLPVAPRHTASGCKGTCTGSAA